MNYEEIVAMEKRLLFPTYLRYPLALVRGQGCRLYDVHGKEYIDMLAGISVCNLGHAHPEISQVICEQSKRLLHVSNLFYTREQLELARSLLSFGNFQKVFFCNSGAEANEAAIKLARRYMQEIRGEARFEIITLEGSFHGRTLATLSATGQAKVKEGFSPLVEGFVTVPPGDIDALIEAITPHTAAIMLEVIQGEGGVKVMDQDFLRQIQHICHRMGLLLIVDEVQTGMARTGSFWAHSQFHISPDIITCAKALANGLPMGAMLSTEEVSQGFAPGSHATTFGGSPLVSAVANKVLEIIERDGLIEHSKKMGEMLKQMLTGLQERHPHIIAEVRGKGLMIGMELKKWAKDIFSSLLEEGFICNLAQGNVLRLLPPLIISPEEISLFVEALDKVLSSLK